MILGIILTAIGVITLIFGIVLIAHSIQVDNKTREINSALEKEKELLEREIELYKHKKRELEDEAERSFERYCDILEISYLAKENEYDAKINNLTKELKTHKQQVNDAFQVYCDALDYEYELKEAEYESHYRCLKQSYDNLQDICIKDLEKIQNTRTAAIAAQKREEELALQADFYSLHLTTLEEGTIALIEELKPRLPDPRVLCMLIWTTFYQKQMTTLCNNVLGPNIVCGIYKITNKKNNMCYIGQAANVADRWKQHAKCGLGIDTPAQNKLYKAMMLDGLTNFTFELLEACPRPELNEKERFYINLYQSYEFGYNSNKGVN
jgi:predicted GIY-YIG superfamily endonuclease